MKALFIIWTLAFTSYASATQGANIQVYPRSTNYVTLRAEVYDGQTGKAFPYRITLKKEVGGCSSIQWSLTQIPNKLKAGAKDNYIVTKSGISPANICDLPIKLYSESFDFPPGNGVLELIVETDTAVLVEKLD